ncbi:uncharacterized protein B0J16DRAFT_371805 [Fusarium flagelliforme]|uniref:Alpha-mannosyltransferase alg11p n=1 Tax=Fusarium flagelliforme TaxID=2675880 RepID=A0A395MJA4_9HYPO|nr:uncharacterized protein B0J16DRAFT_371805 [Fusarium flagelliforme]KAH7184913.1 hypothetical protein B0J16DRAFT_371805 [Fusarium flagelliforme]RFN48007.1 alpha-mannosyltransferase alg11p [Fusarium flagelliforme]
MLDLSNARPIGILVGYLTACAALAAISITSIYRKAASSNALSRRSHSIVVFSALAALSLATTWYHMFRFFQWSYQQWASAHPESLDGMLHLGEWLRDTTLFKQAWVSTLEEPTRLCWSLQIFAHCANWSVMLASYDKKMKIPHLWVFMLLGQIVAISFALNLSLLAFLVFEDTDPTGKATREAEQQPPIAETHSGLRKSWLAILAVTTGCALSIPWQLDHPKFMYLLLAPHVLAFVPLLLNRLISGSERAVMDQQPPPDVRRNVRGIIVAAAIYNLPFNAGSGAQWRDVMRALYEHPAVSSVGWDVICCWISLSAWHLVCWADHFEEKQGIRPLQWEHIRNYYLNKVYDIRDYVVRRFM